MIGHVLNNMNEVITNDYSENHQALDIISPSNPETDIIALESGIVEEVVTNVPTTDHNTKGNATYGNYVKIKQNNGKTALYAHMKYGSINVNIGDYVEKGAIIGTMGSTGNAYGNHLHLEIKNEQGIKENPIISLNEVPKSEQEPVIEETENIVEKEEKIETVEITDIKENDKTTETPSKKTTKKSVKQTVQIQTEYLSNQIYNNGSIVDGLKEIGSDSSYDYREKLAKKNGITNYRGSYEQNVYLLKLLKEGKLIKA